MMLRRVGGALMAAVVVGGAIVTTACGTSFDPVSKIESVRILATKADKPYAKPGDTVQLTMLVADGRTDKTKPVVISWVPAVCMNPASDLYYACFTPSTDAGASEAGLSGSASDSGSNDAGSSDAGTSDGGAVAVGQADTSPGALTSILKKIPPNTNITPFLPAGPSYSFTMPANAVSSHAVTPGAARPYGLAVLFNYACAGHLQVVPFSGDNPQQVPLGCFDDSGNVLSEDNGVFGIVEIYSYTDLVNQNPVITSVTQDGNPIDLTKGITVPHCTESRSSNCQKYKLTPVVPDTSWELDPNSDDGLGTTQHEEIWVDYYTTLGDLGDDARLLYDTSAGKISSPEVDFQAPSAAGEGTIWAVVHDNRGGVEWAVIPLHVM